jgi:hypothetical protein
VSFAGDEASARTLGREAEIKNLMTTDFDAYDRNPALKKEYQEIQEAKERRAGRA